MLPLVLLVAIGLPLAEANVTRPQPGTSLNMPLLDSKALEAQGWTYNVVCFECTVFNTFTCTQMRTCEYETRRCMTVAMRVSLRQVMVYKNCTWNCTFVYPEEVPPETPRKISRYTNFYFVQCCGGMHCNAGGPTNLERDIHPYHTVEEELIDGGMCGGGAAFFLSLAFFVASNILT